MSLLFFIYYYYYYCNNNNNNNNNNLSSLEPTTRDVLMLFSHNMKAVLFVPYFFFPRNMWLL